jgi:hypothetical protein
MDGSSTSPVFLDWLDSLAVILASGVAIRGINAWRREHVGKRRIDLAEETLTLFYEVRDVINGARSGDAPLHHYQKAADLEREGTGREPTSQDALVVTYRLYTRNELFAKIHTLRYRFAAVFGPGTEKPFYDLVTLQAEVKIAEDQLRTLRRNLQGRGPGAADSFQNDLVRLTRLVYGGGGANDPTTQKLGKIVERIEQVCRPVIENYGRTLAGALLMRGRRVLGIRQSQLWFARLRRIWTRPHRASRSGHFVPPSDPSAP